MTAGPVSFWRISKSSYFCFVNSCQAIHGIIADLCSSVYHLLTRDLQLDLMFLLAYNLERNPALRVMVVLSFAGLLHVTEKSR